MNGQLVVVFSHDYTVVIINKISRKAPVVWPSIEALFQVVLKFHK